MATTPPDSSAALQELAGEKHALPESLRQYERLLEEPASVRDRITWNHHAGMGMDEKVHGVLGCYAQVGMEKGLQPNLPPDTSRMSQQEITSLTRASYMHQLRSVAPPDLVGRLIVARENNDKGQVQLLSRDNNVVGMADRLTAQWKTESLMRQISEIQIGLTEGQIARVGEAHEIEWSTLTPEQKQATSASIRSQVTEAMRTAVVLGGTDQLSERDKKTINALAS